MISIIIPLYNRADLVRETIESVLAQTYSDWECVIVDDQSTDNSYDVAMEYALRDPRIKALRRPDDRIKGAPTCRNIGYENSSGELVYFFDSDDLLSPDFFHELRNRFDSEPEADFGVVPTDKFSKSPDKPFSRPIEFYSNNGSVAEQILTLQLPCVTQNMIWRRSLLERNEMMWREGLRKGQDADFGIRTVAISQKGVFMKMQPMVHSRAHGDQMTTSSLGKQEIGETLVDVFVNLYDFIRDKVGFSKKGLKQYMRIFFFFTIKWALLYGSAEGSRDAYLFAKRCPLPFFLKGFYQTGFYFVWKSTATLQFIGSKIFLFRKNVCIRRVLKIFIPY